MSVTTFIYLGIGIGVVCLVWGIRVYMRRENPQPVAQYDDYLDQTCELNHDPEK